MMKVEMWKVYVFQDERVRIVQQWHDPFGHAMVRIEAVADDDDRAMGLREDAFLAEAKPDAQQDV